MPTVVLQSTREAPAGTTKFATHLAAITDSDVRVIFFSWPRALFLRYDVFHLHWVDGLVHPTRLKGALSGALTFALLLRLTLRGIPVVATAHNLAPHDRAASWWLRTATRWFATRTTVEIHMTAPPASSVPSHIERMRIPHPDYRAAYRGLPTATRTPGRSVFFGLLRAYKGIDDLLGAFADVRRADATVRVVGNPVSAMVADAVERATVVDARVSHRFGFLTDADAVEEVSAAQVIVLPYKSLHNSGVAIAALSIGRPILVPDSPAGRALRDEFGEVWVHLFASPLSADDLERVLNATAGDLPEPPSMRGRSIAEFTLEHRRIYRSLVASTRHPRVFAWLTGQDDNVGDSALRRGYVNALRQRGDVEAYVAAASKAYVSGLGLTATDRVATQFVPWALRAVQSALRAPTTVALNAGEFSFSGRYVLRAALLAALLPIARRRGAVVIWAGAAIPQLRLGVTWLFRRLFTSSDFVRWRDSATSEIFEPAATMPDWSLGLGSPHPRDARRSALGISLRFDRPAPSEAWLRQVRACARSLNLEVVVVAQVSRDTDRAEQIATALGGRAVPFDETKLHSDQERDLRVEYGRMSVLFSDRLHALFIAQTEGCVALGWTEFATPKLSRHLDALGMEWAALSGRDATESIAQLTAEKIAAFAAREEDALARSRVELDLVAHAIAEPMR